jgi:MFS transporter, DHA1 family, tetracycline resistance protein
MAFLFIMVFVDLFGYGMILPLLPFYVQRQAGGASAAGTVGALYALMQLISGPALGAFSDRHGRRPILLICLLGTAFADLILGLAGSLWIIYLAVALDGITGGNLTTAYAYIADVTTPQTRAHGLGLVGAAFGLGLMAGPAFGGLLSRFGLSAPAFTACLIALGNVVFGLLALPESLPPERRTSGGNWNASNSITQISGLFRMVNIRLLMLAIFALNLAFSGLQNNFPFFSQSRFGWTASQNGIFYAYVGVCAVFIQGLLFGKIQPRLGEKRLAKFGLACMSLGLVGVGLAWQGWMLYPAVGAVALGSGLSIPSLTSLVSQRVPANAQGRLMGGTQALLSLTMILGPLMAGMAFDRIGSAAPYMLGGFLSCTALFLAILGLRTLQPSFSQAEASLE